MWSLERFEGWLGNNSELCGVCAVAILSHMWNTCACISLIPLHRSLVCLQPRSYWSCSVFQGCVGFIHHPYDSSTQECPKSPACVWVCVSGVCMLLCIVCAYWKKWFLIPSCLLKWMIRCFCSLLKSLFIPLMYLHRHTAVLVHIVQKEKCHYTDLYRHLKQRSVAVIVKRNEDRSIVTISTSGSS